MDNGAPLTNAQRQAAYRARQKLSPPKIIKVERKEKKLSRARKWAEAVEVLKQLQEDYQEWLNNLPEGGSESTRTALEAICDLDLSTLDIDPPKGFGRD